MKDFSFWGGRDCCFVRCLLLIQSRSFLYAWIRRRGQCSRLLSFLGLSSARETREHSEMRETESQECTDVTYYRERAREFSLNGIPLWDPEWKANLTRKYWVVRLPRRCSERKIASHLHRRSCKLETTQIWESAPSPCRCLTSNAYPELLPAEWWDVPPRTHGTISTTGCEV